MNNRNKQNMPKTQHTRIVDAAGANLNPYTVLDSPDDRITRQTGDGTTLVVNDSPDDVEDKNIEETK